jgi:hypothetical protein
VWALRLLGRYRPARSCSVSQPFPSGPSRRHVTGSGQAQRPSGPILRGCGPRNHRSRAARGLGKEHSLQSPAEACRSFRARPQFEALSLPNPTNAAVGLAGLRLENRPYEGNAAQQFLRGAALHGQARPSSSEKFLLTTALLARRPGTDLQPADPRPGSPLRPELGWYHEQTDAENDNGSPAGGANRQPLGTPPLA